MTVKNKPVSAYKVYYSFIIVLGLMTISFIILNGRISFVKVLFLLAGICLVSIGGYGLKNGLAIYKLPIALRILVFISLIAFIVLVIAIIIFINSLSQINFLQGLSG
jgi:hypothetical protein